MNDAIRAFLVITLSDCTFADHIGHLLLSHGEFRRTNLERWNLMLSGMEPRGSRVRTRRGVRLVPQGWY
jgi:hypothetical protein